MQAQPDGVARRRITRLGNCAPEGTRAVARRGKVAVSPTRSDISGAILSASQLQPILLDRAWSARYRRRLRTFVPA